MQAPCSTRHAAELATPGGSRSSPREPTKQYPRRTRAVQAKRSGKRHAVAISGVTKLVGVRKSMAAEKNQLMAAGAVHEKLASARDMQASRVTGRKRLEGNYRGVLKRDMAALAYRSPQTRVRAEMAAMYDGGVKASQEFEVAAARPRLHNVQAVLDAKLRTKRQQEWNHSTF